MFIFPFFTIFYIFTSNELNNTIFSVKNVGNPNRAAPVRWKQENQWLYLSRITSMSVYVISFRYIWIQTIVARHFTLPSPVIKCKRIQE